MRRGAGSLRGLRPRRPFFIYGDIPLLQHYDEETITRLLGSIPEDVAEEVELRTRMYHRAGGSGPIGTLSIIEAVRHCGHKPDLLPEKPVQIDWRQLPQDGSVRVEAKFFGQWLPGQFIGFVDYGNLAIRFDDDLIVKECPRHIVRLMEVEEDRGPAPLQPEPRINLIKDDDDTVSVGFASEHEEGESVWVDIDEDVVDGEYVSQDHDSITVRIGGEEKTVPIHKVTFAGSD